MTTESPYDLDAIREVLGKGDGDDVLLGAIEGMLPDDANLTRVRYVGGSENEVGEVPDAIEQAFLFRAIVAAVEFDTRHTVAGDFKAGDLVASWLHDDIEGQVLQKGDRVIWQGEAYTVDEVTIPEINAVVDFYTARMRRQSD